MQKKKYTEEVKWQNRWKKKMDPSSDSLQLSRRKLESENKYIEQKEGICLKQNREKKWDTHLLVYLLLSSSD